MYPQIIDANVNRITEGLRVIEEYFRFVAENKTLTDTFAAHRKTIHQLFPQNTETLSIRNTEKDMRAKESPPSRKDLTSLLTANFKRVEEALRVLEEYTGNTHCNSLRYDIYELEKTALLSLKKPPIKSDFYLISDNPDILKKGLEWNVSLIQLRDKNASKESIYNRAKDIAPKAKEANVPFIVNDFLDIALLVNADGLHTGQDDLSCKELRSIMGEHKIIGKTTHNLEQGLIAQSEGADYVSVGPIYKTPSKPNRDGIGYDYLKKANEALNIPYVAIGGIDDQSIKEILSYNPPMVGVIRAYEQIPNWRNLKEKETINV